MWLGIGEVSWILFNGRPVAGFAKDESGVDAVSDERAVHPALLYLVWRLLQTFVLTPLIVEIVLVVANCMRKKGGNFLQDGFRSVLASLVSILAVALIRK